MKLQSAPCSLEAEFDTQSSHAKDLKKQSQISTAKRMHGSNFCNIVHKVRVEPREEQAQANKLLNLK